MANFVESEILHIFNVTSVTLIKVRGHVTLPRGCPQDICINYETNVFITIYRYIVNILVKVQTL